MSLHHNMFSSFIQGNSFYTKIISFKYWIFHNGNEMFRFIVFFLCFYYEVSSVVFVKRFQFSTPNMLL